MITPNVVYKCIASQGPYDEWFRSHWRYPESALAHLKEYGTLGINKEKKKAYEGNYILDHVILDFDIKGETHEEYEEKLDLFTGILYEWWRTNVVEDKMEEAIIPFFSGTGFHLLYHKMCFDIPPSNALPKIVKATMDNYFKERCQPFIEQGFDFDPMVYTTTSAVRMPYTINPKSGLYKTPLVHPAQVIDLPDCAENPLPSDFNRPFKGNGQMIRFQPKEKDQKEITVNEVQTKMNIGKDQNEYDVAPCMHSIWNMGAEQAKAYYGRHATVLRLASWFRFQSMPLDAAKASIIAWLESSGITYDKADTYRVVEDVYNNFLHTFGCRDTILAENCKKNCKFYDNKI